MISLLEEPNRDWKQAAFSQFPRPWMYKGESCDGIYHARYRYTEWIRFRSRESLESELYDYQDNSGEIINIADYPAY